MNLLMDLAIFIGDMPINRGPDSSSHTIAEFFGILFKIGFVVFLLYLLLSNTKKFFMAVSNLLVLAMTFVGGILFFAGYLALNALIAFPLTLLLVYYVFRLWITISPLEENETDKTESK